MGTAISSVPNMQSASVPHSKIYIHPLFSHLQFHARGSPKIGLYPGIRMATQKQIEANRRNAQKSTGPKTEQGKAKSKFNALKHGMTAEVAVLPHEDKISYEELRQATIESYQPANGVELMLVELIAGNYWRLLRARRVETATLDLHIRAYKRRHGVSTAASIDDDCGIATAFADPDNGLDNINRYQTTVERAYLRAVEALQKAQNARLRRERQNGFVPHPNNINPVPIKPALTSEPRTQRQPNNVCTHSYELPSHSSLPPAFSLATGVPYRTLTKVTK